MTATQGRATTFARKGIAAYQAARAGRPTSCRFTPSCSAYADEAIAVHGPWRGGRLALRRLARCHPFGADGVDTVPPASGAVR